MPDRHPDATYDPRFLAALRRQARPPRPWGKILIFCLVTPAVLAIFLVICAGFGVAASNHSTIPAGVLLLLACITVDTQTLRQKRARFVEALAHYPGEPRHLRLWRWQRLRPMLITLVLVPLIAAAGLLFYTEYSWSKGILVMSAAFLSGLVAAALHAFMAGTSAGKILHHAVTPFLVSCFLLVKLGVFTRSQMETFHGIVNPIAWPLESLPGSILPNTGLILTAAAVFGSLVVLLLVRWRMLHLPGPDEGPLTAAAAPPEDSATAPHPGYPDMSGEPGSVPVFIPQPSTPAALTAICSLPGALTPRQLLLRQALYIIITLTLAALLAASGFDGLMLFILTGGGLILFNKLLSRPTTDGFPFRALAACWSAPGGQTLLVAGLLPVSWRSIGNAWLRGLRTRMVILAALLILPAIGMEIMVHWFWTKPMSGLPGLTLFGLAIYLMSMFQIIAFPMRLLGQSGRLRRSQGVVLRFTGIWVLSILGGLTAVAAFPFLFAGFFTHEGSVTWGMFCLTLSLLCAVTVWRSVFHILDHGEIDLCAKPRYLTARP